MNVDFELLLDMLEEMENKYKYYDPEMTNYFSDSKKEMRTNYLVKELNKLEYGEKIPTTVAATICTKFTGINTLIAHLGGDAYLMVESYGVYNKIFPIDTSKIHDDKERLGVKIDSSKYAVFMEYGDMNDVYEVIVADLEKYIILNNSYINTFVNESNMLPDNQIKLFDDNEFSNIMKRLEANKLLMDMYRKRV